MRDGGKGLGLVLADELDMGGAVGRIIGSEQLDPAKGQKEGHGGFRAHGFDRGRNLCRRPGHRCGKGGGVTGHGEHRLTKPNHPWTNGQVERMNRTIKDATVKRFHYDSDDQLRTHLADFLAAYNFARRLKTLGGLTPYEYICKVWTSEPDRFILNPIHQMPG
jgi:hypothetical protein